MTEFNQSSSRHGMLLFSPEVDEREITVKSFSQVDHIWILYREKYGKIRQCFPIQRIFHCEGIDASSEKG